MKNSDGTKTWMQNRIPLRIPREHSSAYFRQSYGDLFGVFYGSGTNENRIRLFVTGKHDAVSVNYISPRRNDGQFSRPLIDRYFRIKLAPDDLYEEQSA